MPHQMFACPENLWTDIECVNIHVKFYLNSFDIFKLVYAFCIIGSYAPMCRNTTSVFLFCSFGFFHWWWAFCICVGSFLFGFRLGPFSDSFLIILDLLQWGCWRRRGEVGVAGEGEEQLQLHCAMQFYFFSSPCNCSCHNLFLCAITCTYAIAYMCN
jgi:hypothetical protein